MRFVLFMTYLFPPLGGGGVQRTAKFAKYLPQNGWKPVVITAEVNRRNSIEQGIDYSPMKELKDDTFDAIRCRSWELSHLYYLLHRVGLRKILFEFERLVPLLHMNYKVGWYRTACREAEKVIYNRPVKLIYSSSPPYSCHLAARELQKRYRLPWVADFRDPWTQGVYNPPTKLHEYLDSRLERITVRNADAVIVNTETNKSTLLQKYDLRKVYVIPNGYDPEDFAGIPDDLPKPSRFIVACFGKLHPLSDPTFLFRAYRRFHDRHPDTHLRILGECARPIRNAMSSVLKQGSWESSGRIDHETAVSFMAKSSVLLANVSSENCGYWVPGKLYEYLAARKPILFIGPEKGDAADILKATQSGKVVGFEEEAVLKALEDLYQQRLNGSEKGTSDPAAILKYDRRAQTRELADIFNTLAGSSV